MSKLQTNCRQVVLQEAGEFDEVGMGGTLYLHATEHYEIIDPKLPYIDRFRTDHYTFDLNDEDLTIDLHVVCSAAKLQQIGMMFLAASQDAYQQMYVVKR